MPVLKVGPCSSLPPGSMVEVIEGETRIAVCNVNGEYHAVDGICPHRGGPLAQGALHENMIVCPWHAWEFDCRTGEHDFNSALKLPKYKVKMEGDELFVEVP